MRRCPEVKTFCALVCLIFFPIFQNSVKRPRRINCMSFGMDIMYPKKGLLFFAVLCCLTAAGQDSTRRLKGVFFPYPMEQSTRFAVGFTSTTMPYDVTEEIHYRVPAIDLHLVKRL